MDQKFEIYKLAVEMADRVSARRLTSNAFFVTVNTGLAGLMAFAYANVASDHRFILWIVALVGLLLSLTWFFAIRSYKRLNKSKFEVIHQLEATLEFEYFKREWESLKRLAKEDDEPKPIQKRWLEWKDRERRPDCLRNHLPGLSCSCHHRNWTEVSDQPNYIEEIASRIRSKVDPSKLPKDGMDQLFASYALLALSKGTAVSNEDVHDAWSAWATEYDPDSSSLKPFDELEPAVQDEDRVYRDAIREVADSLD
jgi:hypothetical protein